MHSYLTSFDKDANSAKNAFCLNFLILMPAMRQLFCNFAAMNTNQGLSFEQLAENIRLVDQSMLGIANKTINQSATLRNWIIGAILWSMNKEVKTGLSMEIGSSQHSLKK